MQLNMPDPTRTARRNIAMCERAGMDTLQSALIVGIACESAAKACGDSGLLPGTWFHAVAEECVAIAVEQLRREKRLTDGTQQGGSTT